MRANLKLHAKAVKPLQGRLWHRQLPAYGAPPIFEDVAAIPLLAANAASYQERQPAIS